MVVADAARARDRDKMGMWGDAHDAAFLKPEVTGALLGGLAQEEHTDDALFFPSVFRCGLSFLGWLLCMRRAIRTLSSGMDDSL